MPKFDPIAAGWQPIKDSDNEKFDPKAMGWEPIKTSEDEKFDPIALGWEPESRGIYFSNITELPKIAGQQLATLADATASVPRWLLNKAEKAFGREETKPLSSNFEAPTDIAGKIVNQGLETVGDVLSTVIPGGALGKAAQAEKLIKYAPKTAKVLGTVGDVLGNIKLQNTTGLKGIAKEAASETSKIAKPALVAGLGSGTLEEMGMDPLYAGLAGSGALAIPALLRGGKNALIKAIRNGDVTSEDIKKYNEALIASGQEPVKFGLFDSKNGTFGSFKGSALKSGAAQKKANSLKETITDAPTLESYFENGIRESSPETIIRNGRSFSVPKQNIEYEELVNSLHSPKASIKISEFGNSFKNPDDASHAMKAIINKLSPTGNYIEIARNFDNLPSNVKKTLFGYMSSEEKNKLNGALRITTRMAPRLEKEAAKKIIKEKSPLQNYLTDAISLPLIGLSLHDFGLTAASYAALKAAYKHGTPAIKKKISDLLHMDTSAQRKFFGRGVETDKTPYSRLSKDIIRKEKPAASTAAEESTVKSASRKNTSKQQTKSNEDSSQAKTAEQTQPETNNPQTTEASNAKTKQSQTKTKPSEDTAKQSHESATNEKHSHKNQTNQAQNETVINQMVEELDFIKKYANPNTVNLRQFRNKYLKMGASPEEIAIAEDLIKAHKKSYNTKNKPKNRVSESEIARHSGGADNTYLAGVHTGEVGEFPGAIWKWPERRAPYELVDNYKHLLSEPINLRQTAVQKRNEYKPTPESLAFLDDFIKSKKIKFRTGGKVSNTVPNKHFAVFLSQLSKSSNKMHARR